ncbi:MAG: alpha/beta hydrolase [Candidatus Binatia bacterium]|nr:alpha/beta hydrolase [Candidatus Binatia bacterium]
MVHGLPAAATDAAYCGQPQPYWWLPSVAANFSRPETVRTYKEEMFYPIEPGDFDPKKIETPTLLIHGDDDRLAPVRISQYLVGSMPNAEAIFIQDGSYMLPVTHAPLLADVITKFVQKESITSPQENG